MVYSNESAHRKMDMLSLKNSSPPWKKGVSTLVRSSRSANTIPRVFPCNEVEHNLHNKYVSDVYMLEIMTEEGPEGNPLRIFCFKEPEDVSKTMASRITLEDLEGAYTRNEYKGRDSQFLLKLLEYRHPFALNFWYQLQVDDHSNRRHSPILLERTWETKFWPDRNFTWYLVVTEMNTTLADGYFRCG